MIYSEILNAVKKIEGELKNSESFLDLKKAYGLGDDFLKREIEKAFVSIVTPDKRPKEPGNRR